MMGCAQVASVKLGLGAPSRHESVGQADNTVRSSRMHDLNEMFVRLAPYRCTYEVATELSSI
jgi:hypothetical protein